MCSEMGESEARAQGGCSRVHSVHYFVAYAAVKFLPCYLCAVVAGAECVLQDCSVGLLIIELELFTH